MCRVNSIHSSCRYFSFLLRTRTLPPLDSGILHSPGAYRAICTRYALTYPFSYNDNDLRPSFCGFCPLLHFISICLLATSIGTLLYVSYSPGAANRPTIRQQSPNTFCIKVRHPEFSIICIGSESCLWSIVGLPGSYACYPTFRSIG